MTGYCRSFLPNLATYLYQSYAEFLEAMVTNLQLLVFFSFDGFHKWFDHRVQFLWQTPQHGHSASQSSLSPVAETHYMTHNSVKVFTKIDHMGRESTKTQTGIKRGNCTTFTACSHIFIVFRLKKISASVKTYNFPCVYFYS